MRPQRAQPSETSESAEREHYTKADLQRSIILYGATEVDACDVFLQGIVRDDADAELFFGRVDAEEGETEEQGERLGEEGYGEAGEETWGEGSG